MKKVFSSVALLLVGLLAVDSSAQGLQLNRNNRGLRNRANRAAETPAPAVSAVPTSGEAPALNWDQAPADLVLQAYGERLNKTILMDPAMPKATITLKSREGQKLTQEEYLEAIEVVLEMNGIHLEPYGESFIRALPRKDARREGIPLLMDAESELRDSGRVVSMMIPFKNIATDEAQKILEGLKSATGVLLVFERTNSILVTDTEQNINRMLEIVRSVDVATPVTDNVYVRQVRNASATEIQTALQKIVEESQKEQEKNGKQVNQPQQQQRPAFQQRPGLLGRTGKPNEQPAAVNNESLVMAVSDADRGMIRGKVLILADERSNKLIIVTSKANMDFFDRVIEQLDVETTPDTVVKVYRLKYAEAEDVSDMINDLIGNAPSGKSGSKNSQNQNAKKGSGANLTRNQPAAQTTAKKSANQRTGDAKAGELSKDNTTVLADKRINGLVVMTDKELVPVVEQIIESMDIKLSQVLIETCIIEVNLGHGLETGVDWVKMGRQRTQTQATDALGNKLFYTKRTITTTDADGNESTSSSILNSTVKSGYSKTTTSTDDSGVTTTITDSANEGDDVSIFPMMSALVKGNLISGDSRYSSMLGGGAGSSDGSSILKDIVMGDNSSWGGVTPIGGGLNYFLKSDALDLAAVIKASQTDSRTKYVASPVIMTLDNKEATINATKMRYLLKGFTSSGNSYSTIAVPDYEQKELGIEIKVTPKINPNGTVMLKIEEKYSQVSGQQDIKYATGNSSRSSVISDAAEEVTGETGSSALETVTVDTTATREMSADVLLENMQTVVFGGLTETVTEEVEKGIPILKDIPLIGKWLFGSVEQTEARSELLVFMTPYVLDEGASAQAEALRRKKAMSDPRPWEDNGWSLSPLADPVSKKEQIRRLKDEAKKQDEERATKLAIEEWKVERAKELKKMSERERNVWLEMHKDELEKEKKEEEAEALEKMMQDKKSQEELKALAAKIRKEKLDAAAKEIKANEELTRSENERGKLEAEKKAQAESAAKPESKSE